MCTICTVVETACIYLYEICLDFVVFVLPETGVFVPITTYNSCLVYGMFAILCGSVYM